MLSRSRPHAEARGIPVWHETAALALPPSQGGLQMGKHQPSRTSDCVGAGCEEEDIVWTVVMTYVLVDPDAWKYRRLDASCNNSPKITSWRFGTYQSVPYEAEY